MSCNIFAFKLQLHCVPGPVRVQCRRTLLVRHFYGRPYSGEVFLLNCAHLHKQHFHFHAHFLCLRSSSLVYFAFDGESQQLTPLGINT